MNADVFAEKWEQISGEVKKQWGRITDADLKEVEGHMSRLIRLLQERYDYSPERVEHGSIIGNSLFNDTGSA